MAVQAPSFVNELNESNFKVYIAIDFGTDGLGTTYINIYIYRYLTYFQFIGLAYAINDEVYIHSKWNSTKYEHVVKPKTIILLDEKGEKVQFGMDAKDVLSITKLSID